MVRISVISLFLLVATVANAQQAPSWRELALQTQRNGASDQLAANAIITELQKEIVALKDELAKTAKPEPPKVEGGQ